jgi:hypothetical protein
MGFNIPNDTVKGKAINALLAPNIEAVAGAAADTNMAVASILLSSTIVSVINYAAGVPSDITATCTVTSAGNIQSSGDTTGDTNLVTWV